MKRYAMRATAGLIVALAVLPANGDDVRYGTLQGGGGTQNCETNLGCAPWADGTECQPGHVLAYNNVFGHTYSLRDPWEEDKEVRFTLDSAIPTGYGSTEIVFHVRDASCNPVAPNTVFVPEAVGDSVTFLVPGISRWMVVYMAGTSSAQVGFQISFDHCTDDCAPAE